MSLLAAAALTAPAATINVSNSTQLNSALTTVNPGDQIVLANGTYSGFTITRSGTASAPITIKAANRLGATVNSGHIRFNSNVAHVTVEGLNITTPGTSQTVDDRAGTKLAVWFQAAKNCRLTRCKLQLSGHTGETEWVMLSGNSLYNRVDHCEFGPNSVDSHLIWPRGNANIPGVTYDPVNDRANWANGNGPFNPNMARHTLIDHNYFHDHLPTVSNGGESIVLGAFGGTGDYQETGTIIEYNLWVNCFGDGELISSKSSANTVRYNTIRNCGGGPVSRSGNKIHMYGNFLLQGSRTSSGGFRIHEMDHMIYDNYVENALGNAISVGDGDPYNDPDFSHAQVVRAKIFNNTFVNSGSVDTGNSHPLDPVNLVIANNILFNTSASIANPPMSGWTYSQNLIWPASGPPGFMNVNPLLTTVSGLQKLSATSPAINAANASLYPFLPDDMDGQVRNDPDIGADEFSSEAISRRPLTTADVGPNSPEGTVTTWWEAERITRSANGASATVVGDDNASGVFWVSFNADGAGDFIDFTVPNVPPGNYAVLLEYKSQANRGSLSLSVDGATLSTLDQFSPATAFLEANFGIVSLNTVGSHIVRLTVTGRNPSATAFTLSADRILLVPVTATPVAAPTFTPAPGAYTSAQSVTIETATTGASINYTTDGTTPSSTTGTPYTGPVQISVTTTLKAIAFKSGQPDSAVTSGLYTINLPPAAAPAFNPPAGNYTSGQSVAITSATGGATIRYTTNGMTPTSSFGTLYTGPVPINVTATLKAIAFANGFADSPVTTGVYTIGTPALSWEAETLSFTTNGAAAALQNDVNTSGGVWLALLADGAGDWIQYTLPGVPAGTYQVKLSYKGHPNRGILQPSVNGSNFGGTLDQYSATSIYPETLLGTVTFGTTGNQTLRLTCTGRNPSAGAFTLSSDKITLTAVTQPPPTVTMEAESLARTSSGATTSTANDAGASGGVWLALNATNAGPFMDLTTTSLPAGTYQLQFTYKSNTTRGQHTVTVDGVQVGGTVDQYATTQTFPTVTLGTVTFGTAGTHTIRLTVTGKNPASSNFILSADKFTFVGQ